MILYNGLNLSVEWKRIWSCITEKKMKCALYKLQYHAYTYYNSFNACSPTWFPSLITYRSLSLSVLLPRETPLHVAVRLGFPHLSHFLLQESEGQRMVSIADDEGESPLTLAQKHGDPVLISALTEWVTPSSLTQYTIIRLHLKKMWCVTSVIDAVYSVGWVSCVLWLCYDQSLE